MTNISNSKYGKRFKILNNLLVKRVYIYPEFKNLLYIPSNLRNYILMMCHDQNGYLEQNKCSMIN